MSYPRLSGSLQPPAHFDSHEYVSFGKHLVGWVLYFVAPYLDVAPPRMLPVIIVGNNRYYFDQKLAQLRRVDCPFEYIELSDDEVGAFEFRVIVSGLSQSG